MVLLGEGRGEVVVSSRGREREEGVRVGGGVDEGGLNTVFDMVRRGLWHLSYGTQWYGSPSHGTQGWVGRVMAEPSPP